MHVALVHSGIIPPTKYGGTERIVYWQAKALKELGHEITLVAHEKSSFSLGQFIEYTPDWQNQLPNSVDIVHLWTTPHEKIKKPFLVTIQGNGQSGEQFHPNTVFISKKHAENHLSDHYVYNGIDVSQYPFSDEKTSELVFLAKASWSVKNLKGAIHIAENTKMPLHILGSRDWPLSAHRWLPRPLAYLKKLYFHGMVDDGEKIAVLRRAKALLFPVRWHEPFGIAIIEAMACGCFVIGTPYGSLPEIVDAKTGFLSNSSQELTKTLIENEKTPRFSPQECRKRVENHFSHLVMAKKYLAYYEKILSYGALGKQIPKTAPGFSAQQLLDWH
ncbi:MAG: glycosyltransferase [Bacteriovoracia bacterium]